MNRNIKKYGLEFKKSILSWDEAIPIGNGHLGALIYGDGPIKYAIDCLTLWDKRDSEASVDKDFTFKKLYECAMSGEEGWKRKKEIFEKNGNFPYPTKLSAGRIEFDFGKKTENVTSKLDIECAVANVGTEEFRIESFVSATHSVGVIRVFGDYSLNLHIPGYFSGDENGEWSKPSGLFYNSGEPEIIENGCLKYPRSSVVCENGYTYYVQKSLTDYAFAVVLYTKKCDGYDEIYYTVTSSDEAEDFFNLAKNILSDAVKLGYEKLLAEHKKWWRGYWGKSDIKIGDKEMEKAYYFNWYLFASTSRKGKAPMPLQGVWTADSDALPPWGGDYHHDTNTQMSYWGYAKANRLDEGRVFPDYLWNTREAYKRHAKRVYGVNGYLIPGCSTRDGRFMGTSVQYSLSPTMTIWAGKAFDDYYRYTGDLSYLKNRAYPFLKRVADAIIGLFVVREGKYYLPLSTSPEILEEDRAIESYHIGNSTFDQSLILYLFKTLVDYENILGINKGKYDDILLHLDGLYISENKEIMLSETMNLPYSHRHFSHMMCVYPLHILNYDTAENKKIIDNTLWEIERLGTGWWVGFSFPWCASLYAMAENGDASYEKLRIFVKAFLSPNGFHLNGDYKQLGFSQWHYRPFTLEAHYAFNDAIQEMLMQDHMGYVDLFPAVPLAWGENVEFKNFNSLGKISVSAKKAGENIAVTFKTKKSATISFKNRFSSSYIKITTKNGSSKMNVSELDIITISLPAGTTVIEQI